MLNIEIKVSVTAKPAGVLEFVQYFKSIKSLEVFFEM